MLKITVEELYGSFEPLRELLDIPLPAATSFKVGRISRQVSEEIKLAQETVTNARSKYGDSSEDKAAYEAEFAELLATQVEIEGSKIEIGVLGTVDIKPSIFHGLAWMFKE